MYRLKLAAKAKAQLKNLSKLDKFSVAEIFEDIKENPFIGRPLTRELAGQYAYREGVYRVRYLINQVDQVVTILIADHRGKVYN